LKKTRQSTWATEACREGFAAAQQILGGKFIPAIADRRMTSLLLAAA
jgi:hypothetical protein